MRTIRNVFWGLLALVSLLWLAAEPGVFQSASFFALRNAMVQYSGIVAIVCMSVAMILAARPRWPEARLGGLDKMYRLHKWLGIGALGFAVGHWLWANGPKWAVGWGLLERPQRGPRVAPDGWIAQAFSALRGTAEGVGEWAFYAAALLIVLALLKWLPYRQVFKTHRILAVSYLVLVFHAVVLTNLGYWTTPVGAVLAVLLAGGTWSAIMVLLRRAGLARRVEGTIAEMRYHPEMRALETRVALRGVWPGHKAGQFAFALADGAEGAHPFTIASAWDPAAGALTFLVKELGDHTRTLRNSLHLGDPVRIEGPYGCFTFADDRPHQIWVAGGIGITPFLARLEELAAMRERPRQGVDLFYCTAAIDAEARDRLVAMAEAAGVRLHLRFDARDGRLNAQRIMEAVPQWPEASIWFCGPAGFGDALRRDFGETGFPTVRRFHQELFAMR